MGEAVKRATVYFRPELHKALRLKAAATERSISDLINEAVQASLCEDETDLAAFEERAAEASITYEALLKDLKDHGKL
jgi:plasmid stability protein